MSVKRWGDKPYKPALPLLGQLSPQVPLALNSMASRAAHRPYVSNIKFTGVISNVQTQQAKPRTAFNVFVNFLSTNSGKKRG
jgi:hypothetical protein